MKKYDSIINSYDEAFIEKAKEKLLESNIFEIDLVLMEKIDGSNFSIVLNQDGSYYFCSRNKKLENNANFNNFQEVIKRDNILDKVKTLQKALNKDIIIYGEIFGGKYNGISKGINVKNKVDYCEDNRILFFDIFIGNKEKGGTYLSYKSFYNVCTKYQIPIVPPKHIYENVKVYDEFINLFKEIPCDFTTEIPMILRDYNEKGIINDLSYTKPRETEMIAEGYVVRGYNIEVMISDFDRFIIKNSDKSNNIK